MQTLINATRRVEQLEANNPGKQWSLSKKFSERDTEEIAKLSCGNKLNPKINIADER